MEYPGWLKDDLFQMLDRAHEPDTFPDLQVLVLHFFLHAFEQLVVNEQVVQTLDSRNITREGLARLKFFDLKSSRGTISRSHVTLRNCVDSEPKG